MTREEIIDLRDNHAPLLTAVFHGETTPHIRIPIAVFDSLIDLALTARPDPCELCQSNEFWYTTSDTEGYASFCPSCGRSLESEVKL